MSKASHLSIILILLLHFSAFAQNSITVNSLNKPLLIDGILETEWNNATAASGFTQLEPSKGLASSRKTIFRSAQYQGELYFAFVCYIQPGENIAASIQRRDQLSSSDDIISILLDTYQDNRSALLFQVNALGTLTDAKILDDGKQIDFLWDTEWQAKSSVSDTAWVVEISIPFRSIRYKPNSTDWGINLGRVIRSNQEASWWVPVTENYRISQSGILSGINTSTLRKQQLHLFPYATAWYENSDETGNYNKFKADAGLDVKYQFKSNLLANLTVNPDFATVEGDKEQINLTPWEIKLPDKRLFFQDGNEMFDTRISTFYSRRIGDMNYGGKLIGKTGKFQFNALTANTREDLDEDIPGALFNAVRVKGDILNSSTFGLSYSNKIVDTAIYQSASVDYVLNLGKTWKLTGQLVSSTPGDFLSHSAWFMRFTRENNIYHYHLRVTSLGSNFKDNVNQTGYVPDDNRKELDGDISYRFWINKNLKYLYLLGKNNVFWSQSNVLRSWFLTYSGRAYFENRLSIDAIYNNEYKNEYKKVYKDFNNHYYQAILGYNSDEATYANLSYRTGINFDRNFQLWEFESRVQLLKKLSISYEFNHLQFSPDTTSASTMLNILGVDYFFTKDLWIRLFAQNNSAQTKFYFYGLFGWRFKPPFGAVYFIVNTNSYNDYDEYDFKESQIVFLKFTYPISIIN